MHKLYFILNDKRMFQSEHGSVEDALREMHRLIDEKSRISSYYNRFRVVDRVLHVDYGAHNARYEITNVDKIEDVL